MSNESDPGRSVNEASQASSSGSTRRVRPDWNPVRDAHACRTEVDDKSSPDGSLPPSQLSEDPASKANGGTHRAFHKDPDHGDNRDTDSQSVGSKDSRGGHLRARPAWPSSHPESMASSKQPG